jgi:hypothetical protein
VNRSVGEAALRRLERGIEGQGEQGGAESVPKGGEGVHKDGKARGCSEEIEDAWDARLMFQQQGHTPARPFQFGYPPGYTVTFEPSWCAITNARMQACRPT